MADGAVRTTPYPIAIILCRLILDGWHEFDGWCASRNVDPNKLPYQRFLNLTYYYIMRGRDKESRQTVETELSNAVAAHNLERQRRANPVPKKADTSASGSKPRPGLPPIPPPWWGDGQITVTDGRMAYHEILSKGGKR